MISGFFFKPEIHVDSLTCFYPYLKTQNISRGFHISTDRGEEARRDIKLPGVCCLRPKYQPEFS